MTNILAINANDRAAVRRRRRENVLRWVAEDDPQLADHPSFGPIQVCANAETNYFIKRG